MFLVNFVNNLCKRGIKRSKFESIDNHLTVQVYCEDFIKILVSDVLNGHDLHVQIRRLLKDNHYSHINNVDGLYRFSSYYLTFRGKVIVDNYVELHTYGILDGDAIDMIPVFLLGGNRESLQKQSVTNSESPEWRKLEESVSSWCNFRLQSGDTWDDPSARNADVFVYHVAQAMENLNLKGIKINVKDCVSRALTLITQSTHWIRYCSTLKDYYLYFGMCYFFIFKENMSLDILNSIPKLLKRDGTLQSSGFDDVVTLLRQGLGAVETVANAPLFRKVADTYAFLLTHGLLKGLGYDLNSSEYSKLEKKEYRSKYSSKKEMWFTVCDTVIMILERFSEYSKTGEVSAFLHSGDLYSEWLQKADEIIALSNFVSNLEAHDTSHFEYIATLNDLIEKGLAYTRFSTKENGVTNLILKKKLMSLQIIKNTDITRQASQKERRAPYGVLISGASSVGKSSFTKMIFYYYARLRGLKNDDHYMYARSPADKFWSGFDSSKWCVRLDDVAMFNPNKCTEVDPTISDLINVINNVPYVPPQAAIEDKGKTPILAKLVLATTNCEHINAHEYFSCPLAVQRRLPFVVHISPKPEYINLENNVFLDPSRLPEPNGYPDYWNIEVKKVVPVIGDGGVDRANLVLDKTFDSSVEFLKYFAQCVTTHEGFQVCGAANEQVMKELTVCPLCYYPSTHCECELQVGRRTIYSFFYTLWIYFVMWWFEVQWFFTISKWTARYRLCRWFLNSYMIPYLTPRRQMFVLGELNSRIYRDERIVRYIKIISVASAALGAAYMGYTCYKKYNAEEEEESVPKMVPQGNIFGTTEEDLPEDETTNVWYNSTQELTTFDVPLPSQSLSALDEVGIEHLVSRNCVRINIKSRTSTPCDSRTGGVFIKGHYCIINKHALSPLIDDFDFEIITSPLISGVSSNITIRMQRKEMVFLDHLDLCLFEVNSMPPFKDITKFWGISHINVSEIISVKRDNYGTIRMRNVHGIQFAKHFPISELNMSVPLYYGECGEDTLGGDCGSLAIAYTPRGPVIVGYHIVGYEQKAGFIEVLSSDLEEALLEHNKKFERLGVVVGGGLPQLTLQNGNVPPLTVLHEKSVFRYIDRGVANIYGSFAGFRPRLKSQVCLTPLAHVMQTHFNLEITHGKPCVSGWEPWRKNIIEMVKPNVSHDKMILEKCVNSFVNDVLHELEPGWEKQLVFLSRRASVNGIPKVKFIDRINCSSSMGFPWRTSKKGFLVADVDEKYPEGVDFGPEVWDRVDVILSQYSRGQRSFPVYVGCPKDEPTLLRKCKEKKTRIFTASPVDWSTVVRSRLLPITRLIQMNPFIFEAGPGTVCQSSKWTDFYTYLTIFGVKNMIAGDFGKFDKRMTSDFVLAAFRFLALIYRAAGFGPEEILEILCIGEDTAFPIVDMNGDLIEFFGTNPSGHPLTVIINSIVNCLYMRYCYYVNNPNSECDSFKKNVHLMTYGDDNIMNVSSEISGWFNHTVLVTTLATIGVEYTMADKDSESVPLIHIDDCSFLKRKWVYSEELDNMMCPLDINSIHKSLTVWLPSKTINRYEQMVSVIESANSELFFHGREVFERYHGIFKEILKTYPYASYVRENTLPDWDYLKERYRCASEKLKVPVE
jgi:hypothetical protein